MKKPKFLLKIDTNNRAKIYVGKKWRKDVFSLDITARPQCFIIEIENYKRDRRGCLIVENNEIASEVHTFGIGDNAKR